MIDWLIKLLVNYRYKKNAFLAWTWGIDEHTDITILTAEYYNDYYRYGVRTEFYQAKSKES